MQEEGYKIKLTSKRLQSGNCQIKFIVSDRYSQKSCYGYLLAKSGSTLRQVIELIEERVRNIDNKELLYHGHLYNLQKFKPIKNDLILYQAS
jgi:hypothetical protein